MLWKIVDVFVILVAFGVLLLLGPGVIGFSKWKDRLFRRAPDENSG